jgi:phosphate transport system protein
MTEHTVTAFDEDLKAVDRLIHEMGELAATMVGSATRALLDLDNPLAQRVVSQDAVMDAMQRDLDERAITLIAKRQPVAGDLRSVVGAIRMAADLERIGDLAKNIAKRVGAVGEMAAPRRFAHGIDAMTDLVLGQVEGVVRKYEERDAEGLSGLRAEDEKIDIQYTGVFRELLTYMMEDPRNITACTHLLFCAKNLERIGDHVTNISENAYYVVTGRQLSPDRPKQDETATVLAEQEGR